MTRTAQFLKQIEAFLDRTGMSPSLFSKAVCGDPCFVTDLRRGRKPNLETVERILTFMSEYDRVRVFAGDGE